MMSIGNVTEWNLSDLEPNTDYIIAVVPVDTTLGPYANGGWFENSQTGAAIFKVQTPEGTGILDAGSQPRTFSLEQNYPNPFNPESTIRYTLPEAQHVVLRIYDVQGRTIKTLVDTHQDAGTYNLRVNGSEFASGVYFYQISTDKFTRICKMILVK